MKSKSFSVTFTALFTAVICILSQISFATPLVPLTFQVLAIALCGFTLSLKQSLSATITYLLLGSFGLPVFSNFKGGVQVILGPTGGFLTGFIILTLFCGISKKSTNPIFKIILCGLGLLLCHLAGVLQFSLVTNNGFLASFVSASLPFIFKDVVLIVLAFFLSKFIINRLKGIKF